MGDFMNYFVHHPLGTMITIGLIFSFVFYLTFGYFTIKYGNRKVDRYVKDLFTPVTIKALRKFES